MKRAAAFACAVLLVAGASTGAWFAVHREAPALPSVSTPAMPDPGAPQGLGELPPEPATMPLLEEVRDTILASYYRFVPDSVLSQPSVKLILDGLGDPHSEYLSPLEYERLKDDLSRSYFGVGLVVGPGDGGLIVTSSLDGPARKAGIRPGDVIISVDGQRTAEFSFERSASLIKGEKDTIVQLTVRRPGHRRPMHFVVARSEVDQPSVRSRVLKTRGLRLGYIRVLSFPEDVAVRVAAATRKLARADVEGLVLDLRGDPGGLLSQAIQVTSLFLKNGMVCSTSSLHKVRSYFVSGGAIETKWPIAVLVDHGTASAAEIVAAALSDNERAVLVGKKTYGKATVQTLFGLSNGGALKLTTATYLTPSGTSIRETGIRPQVGAADDPLTPRDEALVKAERALVKQL
jgi:carboxyl-terminal processing protease